MGVTPFFISMATFLHVGCGTKHKNATTPGFNNENWNECRLDIDPRVKPDVVSSITHMQQLSDTCMDAIFSSHNLEHLHAYEVPLALREFVRVLKDDGFLVLTCPDIQTVAEWIAQDKLLEPAYNSPAGPITPLDMVFGLQQAIANGNHYMAHRCGFTQKVLTAYLKHAGFESVLTARRRRAFDLWTIASKYAYSEDQLRDMASQHFPAQINVRKTAVHPQAGS